MVIVTSSKARRGLKIHVDLATAQILSMLNLMHTSQDFHYVNSVSRSLLKCYTLIQQNKVNQIDLVLPWNIKHTFTAKCLVIILQRPSASPPQIAMLIWFEAGSPFRHP